eukprot:4646614-Lingulodinium_polyedra.AAC.1
MEDDQRTFRRQEQTRFRKASKFLSASGIRDKLLSSSMALRPTLKVMGALFTSSSRYKDSEQSILQLIFFAAPRPLGHACSALSECFETKAMTIGFRLLEEVVGGPA